MTDFDIVGATARNRVLVADTVDALPPARHLETTLCDGWTVHTLTAHMLQPMTVGFLRFAVTSLRHRGDVDATIDAIARRQARAPIGELTGQLRALADRAVSPPRVGPYGPFAETCIHLRDLARPLGLDADVSLEHWRHLLDYLVSERVAPALVRPGRLDGLALRATDQPWSSGEGAAVTGQSEAIAMAIVGRRVAVEDLEGPGVALLASRLDRPKVS